MKMPLGVLEQKSIFIHVQKTGLDMHVALATRSVLQAFGEKRCVCCTEGGCLNHKGNYYL